jgi:hypothetical protein
MKEFIKKILILEKIALNCLVNFQILQVLYVAHDGLTETEIIAMFGIHSDIWSPLFFAMEYFIVSHRGLLE